MSTTPLFLEDAYNKDCSATVLAVSEDGGLIFDQTIFYAASGGQPGDMGVVTFAGGSVEITDTVYRADRSTIAHLTPDGALLPAVGETVQLSLNWDRRHAHMRMHTALHLLCSIIPHPVTGGSIGENESRLDFDMPENADKAAVTEALMALVDADHATDTRWITDEELDANPDLVRTLSVQPPRGSGRIRLVSIGTEGAVDLQPCGGTHVKSTREIGSIHIGKVEKKGKMNRRLRVRFGEAPQ
ncbi:MAG: alanyl-tRNA editing protein [Pseudomonadota bacterium]